MPCPSSASPAARPCSRSSFFRQCLPRGPTLLGRPPGRRPTRWHREQPRLGRPIGVASEGVEASSSEQSADYYSLLGVAPTADPSQIKKAYR